jgi:multiple sugar transport system substrate-binding protein
LTRNPPSATLLVAEGIQNSRQGIRLTAIAVCDDPLETRSRETGRDLMTSLKSTRGRARAINFAVALTSATALLSATAFAQGVDLSKWSPEYVRSIAGTADFDWVEHCNAIVPTNHTGRLTFWYQKPNDTEPEIQKQYYKDLFVEFRKAYPNIELEEQGFDYNVLLDKFRTALIGNAAPMAIRLLILGGVEFAAKGYLQPLKPEDVGYPTENFWPGAMKAVTWDGTTYGVPTNNETMALIWNADVFERAGLDPDNAPATWDDVVAYSKQIHDTLGISGYGLVARQNAGNTPYRFMPQLWAYGGGIFDEADSNPTYDEIRLNSPESKRALQASYDMYVRDKSVPTSALTNTQTENQVPFLGGQLGMMISHPFEYAYMQQLASTATGADKETADKVLANMRYGLIPTGPDGKRAVVFGGSNLGILKPEYVEGGVVDELAAKALICMWASPEWSVKMAWSGSNPGNLDGFRTSLMKQRLDEIRFLDVTTSMLPNGIPFPALPESPEIMNIIVPDMMQNALTGKMTVDEAAEDAAAKVEALMGGL